MKLQLLWQDLRGEQAVHRFGCADVKRVARRTGCGVETFDVENMGELVIAMAESNVGDLGTALDEVGDYWGLWCPKVLPCVGKFDMDETVARAHCEALVASRRAAS